MGLTNEQAALLRKPFPREVIGKLPKGGANLDYVGHAATTDRLLQVDPEWTWEPMATDEQGLPAVDRSGNLWIRLTVCGHTRIGVGDGKSAKECIGDAIRNAAMRFGVALDLWSKEELEQTSGEGAEKLRATLAQSPTPPAAPLAEPAEPAEPAETGELMKDKTRAQLFALLNERGVTDRGAQIAGITAVIGRPIESRSELTEAEALAVIKSLRGSNA